MAMGCATGKEPWHLTAFPGDFTPAVVLATVF
jgi:hypothetical protein